MRKRELRYFPHLRLRWCHPFLMRLFWRREGVPDTEMYADMKSTLALESVCAEYQPVPGKNFICWDWMALYGGDTFSMDHVNAVLRERL